LPRIVIRDIDKRQLPHKTNNSKKTENILNKEIYNKIITPAKIIGLGLLICHLSYANITFDPLWTLVYLAIAGGMAFSWLAGISLYGKLTRNKNDDSDHMPREEIEAAETLLEIGRAVKKKPWMLLLIPGEDGLFFLPLLYIGINPVSALVASALFAAAHLACKPLFACVGTFAISYFICLFALPHGIMPVVAGHLILDLSVFAMMPFLQKKLNKEKVKLAQHEEEQWEKDNSHPEFEDWDSFDWEDDESHDDD